MSVKIIISPAKKMKEEPEHMAYETMPCFLEKTRVLVKRMQELTYAEAKKLWGCNDAIAELNYRRFAQMDIEKRLTPAVLAYEGIQYQYMAPAVLEEKELSYIQEHLRILSGFYGLLKPMDGVVPYRLEMQAKLSVNGQRDLYAYWGEVICKELVKDTDCIIQLASREYAKAVEPYLPKEVRLVNCVFAEEKEHRLVQKGTFAKMARGEMVRFLAQKQARGPEVMKDFDRLSYGYAEAYSGETEYVFVRNVLQKG